MEYATTNMNRAEINEVLDNNPIIPKTYCIVFLKNGEAVVSGNHYVCRFFNRTGKMFEKYHNWALIKKQHDYFSFIGDEGHFPY
jgi:hypothetical protein